jgi:formamidopyrimidine-DNA glycosylase
MPELAEVAYSCRLLDPGLGKRINQVITNPTSRVFRDNNRDIIEKNLMGANFSSSFTHGKQMLFSFSGNCWIGIHLGMTGSLAIESNEYSPLKHDALIFRQSSQTLIFRDPRQFGRLRLHSGKILPDWWRNLPTSMLAENFHSEILTNALARHTRRPIKALLLDQRYFPGMGNWMADEVLWRAKINPSNLGGTIKKTVEKRLFKQIKFVAHGAIESVGKHGGDPPKSWLFHFRWKDGLKCPKTKSKLIREQIGGRTTCWCPVVQK